MLIKTLVVGHVATNCYILTDEDTLQCAVIDPGANSKAILEYIDSNKLRCVAILLTHTHFDHVTALPQVHKATGATVYVSKAEEGLAFDMSGKGFKAPPGSVYVKDGDTIQVGNLNIGVIETPGHTPGGLSFVCKDALFSGDTLFAGSCGRTDFPGGNMNVQLKSLKKLADLPGDYDIYPGHADSSRLSVERARNPYMRHALEHA